MLLGGTIRPPACREVAQIRPVVSSILAPSESRMLAIRPRSCQRLYTEPATQHTGQATQRTTAAEGHRNPLLTMAMRLSGGSAGLCHCPSRQRSDGRVKRAATHAASLAAAVWLLIGGMTFSAISSIERRPSRLSAQSWLA
jgi:hypothetical protein